MLLPFATFEQAVSAFRTNPLKEAQKAFVDPIPNHPLRPLWKGLRRKSIGTQRALVYSQSQQIVAQVAQPKPGMKVLDLAAAPGGKTAALVLFGQSGTLEFSNRIHKGRSKILVENVRRFGARSVRW